MIPMATTRARHRSVRSVRSRRRGRTRAVAASVIGAVWTGLLLAVPALALDPPGDGPPGDGPAADGPAAAVLEAIESAHRERPLNAEECLNTNRIRRTRVLTHDKLVFELRGGTNLLVQMPAPCPLLNRQAVPTLEMSGLRLCRDDRVRAAFRGPFGELEFGPFCRLSWFEPINEEQYAMLKREYLDGRKSNRHVMVPAPAAAPATPSGGGDGGDGGR